MKPGWQVLDIGTGRGELVRVALEWGAVEAVGVDYSEAAIELARKTLAQAGNPPGARIELADARRIPVDDDRYDLVTLLDVVEHLTPDELELSLAEARRALRPGGLLLTCTCSAAMSQADGKFVRTVQEAALDEGRVLTLLRTTGAAADHVMNPAYPESRYLTAAPIAAH